MGLSTLEEQNVHWEEDYTVVTEDLLLTVQELMQKLKQIDAL